MDLSQEAIKEFQDLYKDEYGKELSHEEAADASQRLVDFVSICYDVAKEDFYRKNKLKDFPQGFQLNGIGYTCSICGSGTQTGGNWYDKYGIKCTVCQGAINRKEIPPSLAQHENSWYSKYDLESRFNIKGPTLKSWIKKGILKPRTITHDGIRVYIQLFFIKDNKDTLPPKKLTESQMVKEVKDGEDWYHLEPWYRFVNPHEHLKSYKIMDYLKFTQENVEKAEKSLKT